MSRASSIWVVFDPTGIIRATFTVRHELVTWLGKSGDLTGWRVFRHNDGMHTDASGESLGRPTELLDIKDLLA